MIEKLTRVYEVSNGREVDWVVAETPEEAIELSTTKGTHNKSDNLSTTKLTYKQLGNVMIRGKKTGKRKSILDCLKKSLQSRVLDSTVWKGV